MTSDYRQEPPGAGKSSFELIDSKRLLEELMLSAGMTFVDVGCGRGAYSIAASRVIGDAGSVYAVDLWEEGIASLRKAAAEHNLSNIHAVVADVGTQIPLEDNCTDVCLMATVLHDLVTLDLEKGALRELARVTKADGRLAIVEFKKIPGPPGPPLTIRLSPEQTESIVHDHGFEKERVVDLGPYHYLAVFAKLP